MTVYDGIDAGVQIAFGFFALGFLMVFAWGLFLGFVDFMRRMLG